MKNLKLKGLKFNKGKYLLFNDRFAFFPPKVIDILASIYGEGVKSLLVWLGKKTGWKLIQNWEENLKPKSLDDLVNQFTNILSNHGWGRFIPKIISDELIIIDLYHNISSELENKSRYFCYFITGLLSGFGEFALYRVNVIETQCCLEDLNQDYCEFRIEIKTNKFSYQGSHSSGFNSSLSVSSKFLSEGSRLLGYMSSFILERLANSWDLGSSNIGSSSIKPVSSPITTSLKAEIKERKLKNSSLFISTFIDFSLFISASLIIRTSPLISTEVISIFSFLFFN